MGFNRTAIEDALRTWFVGASGLPSSAVVFHDQHAPQPATTYGTILVRPPMMVGGGPDELRWSTAQAWAATTGYAVGARVINGTNLYSCTTAGTSAGSGGPSGTGATIADGSCVWAFVSASAGAEVLPTAVGQREFIVTFEVFAVAVTGSGTALEYLTGVQTSFALPSTQAAFAGAGMPFCFVDCGRPFDLTAIVSTQFQSRASMDVRFRTVDSKADVPIGYIAIAVPTPTYS
jgi:hypothetical protein